LECFTNRDAVCTLQDVGQAHFGRGCNPYFALPTEAPTRCWRFLLAQRGSILHHDARALRVCTTVYPRAGLSIRSCGFSPVLQRPMSTSIARYEEECDTTPKRHPHFPPIFTKFDNQISLTPHGAGGVLRLPPARLRPHSIVAVLNPFCPDRGACSAWLLCLSCRKEVECLTEHTTS